jgi:hypothetical protein
LPWPQEDVGKGDYRFEATVRFAVTHCDPLELHQLAEAIFQQMTPGMDGGVSSEFLRAGGVLRVDDPGAVLVAFSDKRVPVARLVGDQAIDAFDRP